jgi:hypothetical protein
VELHRDFENDMTPKRDLHEILGNLNRRLADAKRFQKTIAERIKTIDKELTELKSAKKQSRTKR